MKLLPQLVNNAEQGFLHRTYARAKVLGDFFARQTFLVLHHEHEALARRHFIEASQNLLNHNVVEGRPVGACNGKAGAFGNVGSLR
jgi:ATP sulfurylase